MNSQLMLTAINIAEGPLVLSLWRPIGSTIYFQLQVLSVGQRRTDQNGDAEITGPHRDGAAVSGLLDRVSKGCSLQRAVGAGSTGFMASGSAVLRGLIVCCFADSASTAGGWSVKTTLPFFIGDFIDGCCRQRQQHRVPTKRRLTVEPSRTRSVCDGPHSFSGVLMSCSVQVCFWSRCTTLVRLWFGQCIKGSKARTGRAFGL